MRRREFLQASMGAGAALITTSSQDTTNTAKVTHCSAPPRPYPGLARFDSMQGVTYRGVNFTLADGCALRDVAFEDCGIWLEGPIRTFGSCRAMNCRFERVSSL